MSSWTSKPYCPERCYEVELTSSRGLAYRVMIAEPAGEPRDSGYAVIYALDGDAVFQTLAETVRLQTRKPKGHAPIIVVGIGYPSREPFDMERRCRDFTMPAPDGSLPARPDGRGWPPHGGADEFLDFLEDELMPAIAEQWPINRSRQLLFGHSLGGLFALHALSARPRLFSHYVAGSPSVWWGENAVLKELEALVNAANAGSAVPPAQPVQLLLAIGADELPDMLGGVDQAAALMSRATQAYVRTTQAVIHGEEHVSVLPAIIGRLPRFIWSG